MMWLINLIPSPYRLIVILVVLAVTHAAAFGAGWKWRDYQAKAEQLEQEQAKITALTSLNARILQIQKDNRRAETKHQSRLAGISRDYQNKLKEHNHEKDRVIAGLRNGSIRLRDPGVKPTVRAGGGIGAEALAATVGRDGKTGGGSGELSTEAAGFLWGEATRADQTILRLIFQIDACQAIVEEDRRLCGSH
jgi:hypothetical protein